ncbi:MAG: hypothetical protein J07AB43_15470 [Candidatus Nanosalina sp. J07AB43]|jgi:hypothetical protein|nr:MAG: hypothetical protein J07AB43_15470 [Candidatus Nanosalina sp. J07AB43]
MSEAQRTVFVQELANESITVVPENVYIDIWVKNDYVVYQNKSYRVAVAQN